MCSLINKQLLLTAYAYLFIMEQQKGQQGSEALQMEKKGETNLKEQQKEVMQEIEQILAVPSAYFTYRSGALAELKKSVVEDRKLMSGDAFELEKIFAKYSVQFSEERRKKMRAELSDLSGNEAGRREYLKKKEALGEYEWRTKRCAGVKRYEAMTEWKKQHEQAWKNTSDSLKQQEILSWMKEDYKEAINSVPRLQERYQALVDAAKTSWGCPVQELIFSEGGTAYFQDRNLANEWELSENNKYETTRFSKPRITFTSITGNMDPYLEKLKIIELMQLAILQWLWKSRTPTSSQDDILSQDLKKIHRLDLPGKIDCMKKHIQNVFPLLNVREELHFATCGQDAESCTVLACKQSRVAAAGQE